MHDVDFEALGFKCGLEIHQQLISDRKLFCRCPPVYRNDPAHYRILRHMRPTLSEMGTYDGTALMEFKTKKDITYEFFRDTTCSYEIDDTPPFEMDERALEVSMVIARAMNCQLVDEVHVSRKQYLDGSIPTGFQRTAIISLGGWVPWEGDRNIDIRQISLEEDACREMKDEGHDVVFRTDRLSIPLVEVVTEPNAKTPEEAGEMAEILGWVMRSTGLVRRGPGATRQDVNVSVEGGRRIEIKGVPFLDLIPPITAGEAVRQHNLLKIKEELENRSLNPEDYEAEDFEDIYTADVKDLFRNRDPELFSSWDDDIEVRAVKVPSFSGIFSHRTHGDQTFLDEISGRIRVIACLDRLPNVYSSDQGPWMGITDDEIDEIKKRLEMNENDAFVLVWGPLRDVRCASGEVMIRCREAFDGVPNETRQVMTPDTTTFERILPGPDRMYPDTDLPPKVVTDEILATVNSLVPPPYWEDERKMKEAGVPGQVAHRMIVSGWMGVYHKAVGEDCDPRFTVFTLMESFKRLERDGVDVRSIPEDDLVELFTMVKDRKISRRAVPVMAERMAMESLTAAKALEMTGLVKFSEDEIDTKLEKLLKQKSDLAELMRKGREGPLMGVVMKEIGARADGAVVRSNILKMLD